MQKIFFEASQHKVVSVCILIIFDFGCPLHGGRFLARTSIENKNGVRCPLFGVVRCLEGFVIEISITNDSDLN